MPRCRMRKIDLLAKIYELKTDLYNGKHENENSDWHDGAHQSLNKVLDHLQEYSE